MQTNYGVLNPKLKLGKEAENVVYNDIARMLFYTSIARMEIDSVAGCDALGKRVHDQNQVIVKALNRYKEMVLELCDPARSAALGIELQKDKLFDMGNMLEVAAKVSGEPYEAIMGMMVECMDLLTVSMKKDIKPDMDKHVALFKLWRNEIQSEQHIATSLVSYDKKHDSIILETHMHGTNHRPVHGQGT